jgi:hypothetical protein
MESRKRNEYGLAMPPVKRSRTVTKRTSQIDCRYMMKNLNLSYLKIKWDAAEKIKENAISRTIPDWKRSSAEAGSL